MAVSASLPINSATREDVWRWLGLGWRDMWAAAPLSLMYGAAFTLIGALISVGFSMFGMTAAIPAAAGGFALLAPLMALGLYEMSRRLEAGEKITLSGVMFVKTKSPAQIALTSFVLMFVFMVWARLAQLIFALFFAGDYVPLSEFASYVLSNTDGLMLISIGTLVGGALAFAVFAVSALSLPLMMDREVDAVSAIATSFSAIKRRPGVMLLWAWTIAIITAVGAATAFVGLIVAFPLLGHATWHAYRQLVGESPPAAAAAAAQTAPMDWSQDRPLA